jgi:predicted DNA-binding WGR domain protein
MPEGSRALGLHQGSSRRFYSLMIERDLIGTVRLVRNWGRIGTKGQELVDIHADETACSYRDL